MYIYDEEMHMLPLLSKMFDQLLREEICTVSTRSMQNGVKGPLYETIQHINALAGNIQHKLLQ